MEAGVCYTNTKLPDPLFIKHSAGCCKDLTRFQSSKIVYSDSLCRLSNCFGGGTNSWNFPPCHFYDVIVVYRFMDDCSHEIKRCLLLERKVMTNLDSILKSRDRRSRGLRTGQLGGAQGPAGRWGQHLESCSDSCLSFPGFTSGLFPWQEHFKESWRSKRRSPGREAGGWLAWEPGHSAPGETAAGQEGACGSGTPGRGLHPKGGWLVSAGGQAEPRGAGPSPLHPHTP